MNQYWSLSGPVLVANSDQYSSDRRPVLVEIPLSRVGGFAFVGERRGKREIGGADVTDFMVYSYCLRWEIW